MNEYMEVANRLRRKFYLKDSDPIGFLGLTTDITEPRRHKEYDTDRVIEFVATTQDLDLDQEIVMAAGADWSYWQTMATRSLYLDHMPVHDYHVGSIRTFNPFLKGGATVGWRMAASIFSGMKNHRSEEVWIKSKQQPLAFSIGFVPRKMRAPTMEEMKAYPTLENVIEKWTAVEVSITGTPANHKATSMIVTDTKSAPRPVIKIERNRVEI